MKNRMNNTFQSGDIITIAFPFADFSRYKIRPVVIISMLPKNAFLVAYITSSDEDTTPYDVFIHPNKQNNIRKTSRARMNRLITVDETMIHEHIGSISKTTRKDIARKIMLLHDDFLNT